MKRKRGVPEPPGGPLADDRADFAGPFAMALTAERAPWLVALRDHPRAAGVVWEEGVVKGQAMVWACGPDGGAVRMRGITKIIDRAFRPTFDYKKTYEQARANVNVEARRKRRQAAKKRAALQKNFRELKRAARANPKLRGTARGTTIHAQVCDSVILGREEFQRAHPSLLRWTVGVMAWLKQNGIRPVFAEYPVTSWQMRVTTPADLICVKDGRIIVVELKTGYDNMFATSTTYMREPFARYLRNSVKHAAFLQAWLVALILRIEYRVPDVRAMVLHVSGDPAAPTIRHWEGPPKLLEADPTALWRATVAAVNQYSAAANGKLSSRPEWSTTTAPGAGRKINR